jgi:uncharacterized membrane protein
MGLHDIRRDRRQFARFNYRLRLFFLGLATVLIVLSVVLAIMIFSYVFNIATQPMTAKVLVEQWAAMFLETSTQSTPPRISSGMDGPARWLAVITLITLAYLLIRIPLLMLQMGTQLLISCQEDNRSLREFIRQLLEEIRNDGDDSP